MQDKEFAVILQDEPQQPLALLPLTEEEQVRHTSSYITGEASTFLKNLQIKKDVASSADLVVLVWS